MTVAGVLRLLPHEKCATARPLFVFSIAALIFPFWGPTAMIFPFWGPAAGPGGGQEGGEGRRGRGGGGKRGGEGRAGRTGVRKGGAGGSRRAEEVGQERGGEKGGQDRGPERGGGREREGGGGETGGAEEVGQEGRGERREGREDRGPERGGWGEPGPTRPGSETPRVRFGKEPWEKERHDHDYGAAAAADARTLGPWGSLSVSKSERVKSGPGSPFGGSRWCVGAGPTWSLRVPNPGTIQGGGGVPRKDPLREDFSETFLLQGPPGYFRTR